MRPANCFAKVLREIHGRFFEALSQVKGGLRIPPSSEPDPNILFDVRVSCNCV